MFITLGNQNIYHLVMRSLCLILTGLLSLWIFIYSLSFAINLPLLMCYLGAPPILSALLFCLCFYASARLAYAVLQLNAWTMNFMINIFACIFDPLLTLINMFYSAVSPLRHAFNIERYNRPRFFGSKPYRDEHASDISLLEELHVLKKSVVLEGLRCQRLSTGITLSGVPNSPKKSSLSL